MSAFQAEVDARGLNCPLPILRLKKAVQGLDAGKVVRLLATDPGSVKDVEAFCRQTGHTLVAAQQAGTDYLFLVRKDR
ncbi:MAG: sulfurtransferase TusA family protein [Gammaproteobacteria bacterium]|nr:MAG: sulfurtransferase TusA family protein [Gammaproteobacteria bacterium]